jgi:hypothetical protein
MNKTLLVLLAVLSGSVYAAPSKWVDEQGKVHYSDQPPKHDAKVEQLHFKDTGGTPPADNPYGRKSTREMEEDFQRGKAARANEAKKEEQNRAVAEAKQANCTGARNNLRAMQQSARMFKMDENGERVYMDDSQRQQQLEAAQRAVSEYCN